MKKDLRSLQGNLYGANVVAVTTGPDSCVVRRQSPVQSERARHRYGEKHPDDSVRVQTRPGGSEENQTIPGTKLPMIT